MNPVYAEAFADLHDRDVEDFGDPEKAMWWPAERNGAAYVVRVTFVQGAARANGRMAAGMLEAVTDSLVIHAARADFPFPPEPNDDFLIGPADHTGAAPDAAKCRLHRIPPGGMADAPAHTHLRFTAERA